MAVDEDHGSIEICIDLDIGSFERHITVCKGRALPFTKPVFTQASIKHKVEYNILPNAHLSMHV